MKTTMLRRQRRRPTATGDTAQMGVGYQHGAIKERERTRCRDAYFDDGRGIVIFTITHTTKKPMRAREV
jgi:hypothetical protein